MIENQLREIFQRYLNAFKHYDLNAAVACYHLPCTLSTPDNLVIINNENECKQEFNRIFTQLKANYTHDIIAKKLCYQQVTDNIYLVCIDWDFIDESQQIFADFAAIYHLEIVAGELKIINVSSHELANSLELTKDLHLKC